MPDPSDDDSYPLAMRAAAVLGLFVIGALAFVLLDVMSGGKLTGGCGCTEKADDDA